MSRMWAGERISAAAHLSRRLRRSRISLQFHRRLHTRLECARSVYEALLARHSPVHVWALTPPAQQEFEALLPPSPRGDRWAFANPPRCVHCRAAFTELMGPPCIYYLLYPDSVELGIGPFTRSLQAYIEDGMSEREGG